MKTKPDGSRTHKASATAYMLEKWLLPKQMNRDVADITLIDIDRLLTQIRAGQARTSKQKPTWNQRYKLAPPKPTPVRMQ